MKQHKVSFLTFEQDLELEQRLLLEEMEYSLLSSIRIPSDPLELSVKESEQILQEILHTLHVERPSQGHVAEKSLPQDQSIEPAIESCSELPAHTRVEKDGSLYPPSNTTTRHQHRPFDTTWK